MKRKLASLLSISLAFTLTVNVSAAEFSDSPDFAVIQENSVTEETAVQQNTFSEEDPDDFCSGELASGDTEPEEAFGTETENLSGSTEFTDESEDISEEDLEENVITEGDFSFRILENGTLELAGYHSDEKNVIIPESVQEIPVTGIGKEAFQSREIISVYMPDSIMYIGTSAFASCEGIVSIQLPEKLESIDANAFGRCRNLQSVYIPGNVSYIGDGAFYACYNLKEIQVAADNQQYLSRDGVLFTSDGTTLIQYPAQKQQTTYDIPEGTVKIAKSALRNCDYLEKVSVPEGVSIIDMDAFAECDNLTEVKLPSTLKKIRTEAFIFCQSLKTIRLPEGLETVEEGAFVFTALSEITFPAGMKYISLQSLGHTSVTKITILSRDAYIDEGYLKAGVTIYGYSGSTVQSYAAGAGVTFVALDVQKPAAVKLNKPSVVSGDHIKISWKAVPGASGYLVYKKSGSSWKSIKNVSANTLSYTDKNTKIGSKYQYTVKAYKNSVKGTLYGGYDKNGVTITQTYYSKAPVKFQVQPVATRSVKITWTARSKATGYLIYRKTPGGSWKHIKTVGKTTSYTDSSCKSAATYYYTVKAYTKNGSKNYYSPYDKNGLAATTRMLTPKVAVKSKSRCTATVTWSSQSNVSGYIIYRKAAKINKWEKIKTVSYKTTSFTDKSLKSGRTYYYTVKAYKKASPSKGIPKTLYGPYNTAGVSVKIK